MKYCRTKRFDISNSAPTRERERESIECFAKLNTSPESRFYGFDTFEGLPEDYIVSSRTVLKKETFSTGGIFPQIDDSRVKFFKGLF